MPRQPIEPKGVSPHSQSFDPGLYDSLAKVEDRHFWFRSRNKVIASLARQVTTDLPKGYRILEVGCGSGNVLRMLKGTCEEGTVLGMDLHAEGLRHAQQRAQCSLIQGDIRSLPFGIRFEVVGLFDVLEHIPDDVGALSCLGELLVPEGFLLLTVPAHASLWSYFDEASHHCRRYSLSELKHKLTDAGFVIEYASYYMMSIFPLVWLGRRLSGWGSKSQGGGGPSSRDLATRELKVWPLINRVIGCVLTVESWFISHGRGLPTGTSIAVIARRSAQSEVANCTSPC